MTTSSPVVTIPEAAPPSTTTDFPSIAKANHEMSTSTSSKFTSSTDETASMADDTTVASMSYSTSLFAPPVADVSVDTRNVRQRMREQEAKINALLHCKPSGSNSSALAVPPAAASDGILLKLVQTLEDDLKKTEAEKEALQESLEELTKQKNQQPQLDVVESALDNKEDVSVASAEASVHVATTNSNDQRVAQLETEVRQKTTHISLLHDRWETTLRRMVAYQCDVETHDLHYTDYAAQQMAAGQETLEELKDLTSKDNNKETRQLGKKAKRMMSTLLNDLEALGERYQEARVAHEQQLSNMKDKQGKWQRRAEGLEAQLQVEGIDVDDDSSIAAGSHAQVASGPLMKFRQKLRLQESAAAQEQEELRSKMQASQWQAEQTKVEKDILEKEVDRLQQTVTQLQQVTHQQQDVLQTTQEQLQVQSAAVAAQHQKEVSAPKKKKFFKFGSKKGKTTPAPPAIAVAPSPLPQVDVAAALLPMQQETMRFDCLHEQMQGQRQALLRMQTDVHKEMRQKAQLAQTLSDLRVEQEKDAGTQESDTVTDLQNELVDLEAKRIKEQQDALAIIQDLQARLAALEC